MTTTARVQTGLQRLLAEPERLAGRRFALLAHAASVTSELQPIHLALQRAGRSPAFLLGPEHGYYAVEQDMIPARETRDPWTGLPIVSLYGDGEDTLRPDSAVFEDVDLLLIDLQDVGSRYYTYAATAVWAGAAAASVGCEVWLLDRPNPLGGDVVEGALRGEGFDSFVGAFAHPVRHGLTLGELLRLEAEPAGWLDAVTVWQLDGWQRSMLWPATGLPWIAPSPNMPTFATSVLYPGGCLIEATEISEGRGTTRPFHLIGAPHLEAPALADDLQRRLRDAGIEGCRFVPSYFRPQFQKHGGAICAGVEWVLTDADAVPAYRVGIEVLAALVAADPDRFAWRQAPYEFVTDIPAIDLLTGGATCRRALEGDGDLHAWIESWQLDEDAFREQRQPALLYP